MLSINIKKYKGTGERFLSRLAYVDVFTIIRFFIGVLFVWSLLYFSGLGFVRNFIAIGGMAALGITSLMSIIFNDGFKLPKTSVMYGLLGFVCAVILSGLFSSGSLRESFIGFGVEIDTVMFIVLWTILITIVASVVHSNKQIFHLLSLITVVSGLTVLFYIVNNVILGSTLSFFINPITVGILSVVLVTLTAFVRQFSRSYVNIIYF